MRLFFLIIFLSISCASGTSKIKEKQLTLNSKVDSSFYEFWNNLGRALRNNDRVALDKYLGDKVVFYGREDQDPKFELANQNRITKILEIYANGGFYDDLNDVSVSYVDFFLDSTAFESEYKEGRIIQDIQDFSFQRNSLNEWKLIHVYCNTKSW